VRQSPGTRLLNHFMQTSFALRRKKLRALLKKERLDSLLVTSPADWFYLAGFSGEAGSLVVSRDGAALLTDSRFIVQARAETAGVRVIQQKGTLFSSVGEHLQKERFRRVGYDPAQVTVAQLAAIRKSTGARLQPVQAAGLVASLRARKDPSELAWMRKAGILASEVVQSAIGMLRPGVREFEIAAEIEYLMRRKGASGAAFETIVAFGHRAALPHARPTAKRLRKNELVVLDLGAILGHYCSDMTRTVFLGKAPQRVREWHKAVREAQAAAIEAAAVGRTCEDVDAAARKVLAGCNLEPYFVHSTGHGLGLEVHEDPRLARGQKRRLEPGNVITIEPGVYFEGVGGIRIEDDVAIHENRTEILTRGTRDLIEL
jgi:Xaa-Pro aminopeptidase